MGPGSDLCCTNLGQHCLATALGTFTCQRSVSCLPLNTACDPNIAIQGLKCCTDVNQDCLANPIIPGTSSCQTRSCVPHGMVCNPKRGSMACCDVNHSCQPNSLTQFVCKVK